MRNRISLLFISAVVLFFTACQKDLVLDATNTNGLDTAVAGLFLAKIDGVQWNANAISSATRLSGVIALYGSNTDGKSILLRVADSGVHNYGFTTPATTNVGAYIDSTLTPVASFTTNSWLVDSTYGYVNITAIDTVLKTITGTFSMKVYRQIDSLSRDITDGVFSNIPYSTSPPPPSATDTFRVKIDSVDFNYNSLSAFDVSINQMISITASQGSASVGINVPDTVLAGNYSYDLSDYVGQYNPNDSTFLRADSGTLTILENNTVTKRIRGSFFFHAKTLGTPIVEAELTEGYFSVVYQ